eukprot:Hpha_TRINITY_DN6916_c0_g1::TRINITY_DN6916_c0_g1_i2::g.139473::m.139473
MLALMEVEDELDRVIRLEACQFHHAKKAEARRRGALEAARVLCAAEEQVREGLEGDSEAAELRKAHPGEHVRRWIAEGRGIEAQESDQRVQRRKDESSSRSCLVRLYRRGLSSRILSAEAPALVESEYPARALISTLQRRRRALLRTEFARGTVVALHLERMLREEATRRESLAVSCHSEGRMLIRWCVAQREHLGALVEGLGEEPARVALRNAEGVEWGQIWAALLRGMRSILRRGRECFALREEAIRLRLTACEDRLYHRTFGLGSPVARRPRASSLLGPGPEGSEAQCVASPTNTMHTEMVLSQMEGRLLLEDIEEEERLLLLTEAYCSEPEMY